MFELYGPYVKKVSIARVMWDFGPTEKDWPAKTVFKINILNHKSAIFSKVITVEKLNLKTFSARYISKFQIGSDML